MRALALVTLMACGRIGFDPSTGADDAQQPDVPFGPPAFGQFGAGGSDWIRAVIETPSGIVVAGGNGSGYSVGGVAIPHVAKTDVFVMSLYPNGGVRWVASCGGPDDELVNELTVDAAGNVYVTGGGLDGSVDCGGGPLGGSGPVGFIASWSPSGAYRWSRGFQGVEVPPVIGTYRDNGRTVLATGNTVTVGGTVHGTVDFGGGNTAAVGQFDMFLATYDLGGAFVRAIRNGGNAATARALAVDSSNQLYVAAEFQGNIAIGAANITPVGVDGLIIGLDDALNYRWHRQISNVGDTSAGALVAIGSMLYVGGRHDNTATLAPFSVTCAGEDDAFFAQLTTAGVPNWMVRYGGLDCDRVNTMQNIRGQVVATATYEGNITVDMTPITGFGARDSVVLSIDPSGRLDVLSTIGTPGDDQIAGAAAFGQTQIVAGGYLESVVVPNCQTGFQYDERTGFFSVLP